MANADAQTSLGRYLLRTALFACPGAMLIGWATAAIDGVSAHLVFLDIAIAAIGGILLAVVTATTNHRRYLRPLAPIIAYLHAVGKGNLTGDMEIAKPGQLRGMADGVRSLVLRTRLLLAETERAVHSLTDENRSLSAAATVFLRTAKVMTAAAAATNGWQARIHETSNAMAAETDVLHRLSTEALDQRQTVSAYVTRAAASLADAQSALAAAVNDVTAVQATVRQGTDQLHELTDASQSILDTASLLSSFSEQTHVLSMNAAIEAKRAGDAGTGFAAIANEVKRLAERSQQASDRIDGVTRRILAALTAVNESFEPALQTSTSANRRVERADRALMDVADRLSAIAPERVGIDRALSESIRAAGQIHEWIATVQQAVAATALHVEELNRSASTQTAQADAIASVATHIGDHAVVLQQALAAAQGNDALTAS